MNETYRILVTGGAGYLGSVIVPALLDAGHRVRVLDNFLFGQQSLNSVCANKNFDAVKGDARRKDLLAPLVEDADIVIPLAALVGAPMCESNPLDAVSVNLDSVASLMELLSPTQRVLMPITNSGYGIGEPGKLCTEETPLRPVSLYGKLKVEAESLAHERENTISFRLATVFGMSPRMRTDLLVNDFVYRATNDRALILFESHFKRNYIHVQDVARAFVHGIQHFEEMKGEAYNVGLSDANLSKRELCEKIKQHLPDFVFIDAPIGEDLDKRDYIVSNEKIESQGYRPAFSLDDGIAELIKGYKMMPKSLCGNI